jgi:hypothetical protein
LVRKAEEEVSRDKVINAEEPHPHMQSNNSRNKTKTDYTF